MAAEHPIKQLILDTQEYWDQDSTPAHIREQFHKIIECGTIALGAEVYASATESKIVYHTCKSRFCTSCGQRSTEEWEAGLRATLPNIRYVGITLTMPKEFRPLLQENPHILRAIPAMGAEAIKLWAKARHGVQIIIIVVQQTAGGFLNFVPHLHIMVSDGGLHESESRWVHNLRYIRKEIMQAWRFALLSLVWKAHEKNSLSSSLSSQELFAILETYHKRAWQIFITRPKSKAYFLKHDGRYVRRPPVAQHRLTRITNDELEYLAKDTRKKNTRKKMFEPRRYSLKEFVDILMLHMPRRGEHAMRYFGLLAPRCKAKTWSAIFVLLAQQQSPHPRRLSWRYLRKKTFGIDPLLDSTGQTMHWISHLEAAK
jgi:hypothetical protein